MRKFESIAELREALRGVREQGRRVGFVPTMGALHEGHLSLVRRARAECGCVVVSIFVNPTQFAPGEDYERYPRPIEADLESCRKEGVDLVFCPTAAAMYPPGSATTVAVRGMTETLCGPHRPGHFDGVTTVVAKLFNVVQPDAAYFGQKDAQQAVVIRRMTRDLCWPIEIVVCPTVREADGLAMSSRNAYLDAAQRKQAAALYRALTWARERIEGGRSSPRRHGDTEKKEGVESRRGGQRDAAELVRGIRERITSAGPCMIDYVEIVDADELTPKERVEGRCLIALAVRIGPARLIDNVVVDGPGGEH